MPLAELHPDVSGLMSVEDREQVREQLNRILETNHFKNSRRYPALLRFIVEETLEGRGDQLKERLLGVQVFDRPSDYDTATDPIVRVTIAEIRKRIAQYYHDEEHDAEIRIELTAGRYAPEFRSRREPHPERDEQTARPAAASVPAVADQPAFPAETTRADSAVLLPVSATPVRRLPALWQLLAPAVLLIGAAVYFALRWFQVTALEQFWEPIMAPHQTVLLCLPTQVGTRNPVTATAPGGSTPTSLGKAGPTSFLEYEAGGENVVFSDMNAALNVVNMLVLHHREYHVKLNTSTSLDDLRHGPAVLVGGLDNPWTMRALNPLPYHFQGSDDTGFWITNPAQPGNHDWSLDLNQQVNNVTRDYAIVARIHNQQTGEPQLLIAGIGMSGTAAAGEFVGSEAQMQLLRAKLGNRWRDHDFEVVLSTDVVNGIAGSPKIMDVQVF